MNPIYFTPYKKQNKNKNENENKSIPKIYKKNFQVIFSTYYCYFKE